MTINTNRYCHQLKLLVNVLIKKGDKYVVIEKNFNNKTANRKMIHSLGGHIDHGENSFEAAKREIFEESGIKIKNIKLKAVVTEIKNNDKPAHDWTIFHFTAYYHSGKITESEEGKILILNKKELLAKPILDSFNYILTHLLSGKNKIMFATFYYENGRFIDKKKKIFFTK